MRPGKLFVLVAVLTCIIPLLSSSALANKSAVSLQVPSAAQRGSEVVIQVKVTHEGNNFLHYTDDVTVTVNGKEIARWKYTATNRPETENFTREVKYTVTEDLDIKAEANCNLHGSAGPASAKIQVKD